MEFGGLNLTDVRIYRSGKFLTNCLNVMSLSLHIVRYEVKLALLIFSSLNYKILHYKKFAHISIIVQIPPQCSCPQFIYSLYQKGTSSR